MVNLIDLPKKNSSSHEAFCEAKQDLVDRLQLYWYPQAVINKVACSDPYAKNVIHKILAQNKDEVQQQEAQPSEQVSQCLFPEGHGPSMWFVFPYHPVWEKAKLNKLIESFIFEHDVLVGCVCQAHGKKLGKLSVKMAWKNCYKPLYTKLRAMCS